MSYKEALAPNAAPQRPGYEEWLSFHLNEPVNYQPPSYEKQPAIEAQSLHNTLPPTAWMGRCGSAIAKRPLRQVVLPGSHDSGTYSLSKHSIYGGDLHSSWALRALSAVGLGKVTRGIVSDWAVCQTQNMNAQLHHGIRYFDIRFSARNNEFFIWHGLCGEKAESVFETISKYAVANPTEILILDLWPHHFNEFNLTHHRRFAQLVYNLFGPILCRPDKLNPWSTVEEFWASQTNVIFLYEPPVGALDAADPLLPLLWHPNQLDSFWPSFCKSAPQWVQWAGTHVTGRTRETPLWVLQCVVTPDANMVASPGNGLKSVKDIATILNPHAVQFLARNPNQNHNIVMLDFYETTGLCQAVQWANVAGQPIFSDALGFQALGHMCHFQTISVQSPSGVKAVALAFNKDREWHTATLDPTQPLPWSLSPIPHPHTCTPSASPYVNSHYPATMNMFTIDSTLYSVIANPAGSVYYRFSWDTATWTETHKSNSFGAPHGFSAPDPTFRSTFTVLSSETTKSRALALAHTLHGLVVAEYDGINPPVLYNWNPSADQLNSYFADNKVTRKISAGNPDAASSSAADPTSRPNSPALPSVTLSSVHTAYVQLRPFYLKNKVYIFIQGPVSQFFPHPPALLEHESIAFMCCFEVGKVRLLQVAGMPPPIHRGTRVWSNSHVPPCSDILLGSPWFVETLNDVAYFICRSEVGIRTWKFDGGRFEELAAFEGAFTDSFHWSEPVFASSLRTFVLKDRIYFMGRSSSGLVLIVLSEDKWQVARGMAEFADVNGWTSEEHAKSLQVNIVGQMAYVTGRNCFGLLTVGFNGEEWIHFERYILPPFGP